MFTIIFINDVLNLGTCASIGSVTKKLKITYTFTGKRAQAMMRTTSQKLTLHHIIEHNAQDMYKINLVNFNFPILYTQTLS